MAILAHRESQLLIDGKLAAGSAGTFPTVNPATEEVLGVAADAGADDMGLAIEAARLAFDDTDWSRNTELRVRCLRQLQAALTEHLEELREITIAEVGLTTRLVVPRARYDEAVEAAAATMASIKPGDPTNNRTVCGPLISARQRDRVLGYLDLALQEGGRFACGGGRPADRDTGFFIEPTVVAGLTNDARVAREEIFGPVLTVIAHDGDDDAVRIANDSPYGLSGTVFSGDPERAAGVAARLRVGTVNVNGGVWFAATRRSAAISSPGSAGRWACHGSRSIPRSRSLPRRCGDSSAERPL